MGEWTRRCQHLVSPLFIAKPHHAGLLFGGAWGRKSNKRPEDLAYIFDQEMGRRGIPYWMTLVRGPLRREFFIIVSEAHAEEVEAFIARIEKRPAPTKQDPPVPASKTPPDSTGSTEEPVEQPDATPPSLPAE